MPNYTNIPDSFKEEYYSNFLPISNDEIKIKAEQDPVIFAFYHLGKKVRYHQAYIMQRMLKALSEGRNRVAMCLARQLGKSIMLAIFLVWAAWYNKFPATIAKITTIYIISRDESASIELLDKIRGMLNDGDRNMAQFGFERFFNASLKEPNNLHQITFLNNCFIKSIPPTGQVLGKSASIMVIDEAHRLSCEEPDKFFNQFVVPTVAETGGIIILSSSPEGVVGFFYDAIDPDNKNKENHYEKIWFDHSVWNDGSPESIKYQAFVQAEKSRLMQQGMIKYWQQEYQALFTVTQTSFFDNKDIEDGIKDTPQYYEWKETPCSVGYDYGIKTTRTVLTIRAMIKNEIIQLFQYRCVADFDINNLVNPSWEHSIQRLKERYNIFLIIPDDCPQGDQINRWFETNSGIQVKKYNFRSDQMSKTDGVNRNCAAYSYRAKLKEGILKIPLWNTIQQFEMKLVQEVEQKVYISIKSPSGQLCDTFDSDMMACIPFLDMQSNYDFEVDIPKDIEQEAKKKSASYDDFHSLTDDECREMIKQANEGLI